MAFPYGLDPYLNFENQDSLYHDRTASESRSFPSASTERHSRTTSQSSSKKGDGTPNSGTPRGSISKGNHSSEEPLTYHPRTGVFQAATKPSTSNANNKVDTVKQKPKKKGTFSSMSSSINRPRGSVFKRALFSVGIQTKDSRLLSAAERGDVESVSNFLSAGADVNWQNEHGETALIYAAWGGYEAVVAALLHHPPTAANIQDNEGWTPLMWAAKAGHEGVVRLFLVHPDTEPDLVNNLGETALMKAAVQGHAKVVKLLSSSYRTIVDKRHPDGSTALLWAAAGGSIHCVNFLLAANANIDSCDSDGMDSLMWAVSVGHVEVVELLIQKGCDLTKRDKVGRTPLIMAAEVGHAEVASFLLHHDETDVNATTKDQITALMRATNRGHSPLVNMMIKCKDLDVNLQDSQGRSALFYGARAGQTLCVSIILNHPEVKINLRDIDGFTACMMAASFGHDEALEALLKCEKNDLKLESRHGLNALSLASRSGHRTAVKALLAHPSVDINSTDGQSMTALAWAARQGSVLVVELLQQYQSLKPNIPNSDGITPLMWATLGNQLLVVKTLVRDPRVDPLTINNNGKSALDLATEQKLEEITHFLRRYRDVFTVSRPIDQEDNSSTTSVSSRDSDFSPPSTIAARFNEEYHDANVDTVSDVDRFLENGPFVNWRPKSGKTSFAWAVACGQTEVVKVFLLVPNIDVNEEDSEGFTPIMVAACNGHSDIIRLLLTHEKTDVNRGDRIERTALMMAATNGHLRSLITLLSCQHIDVNHRDIAGHSALTLAAQIGLYEITSELMKHPDTKANLLTKEHANALIYAIRGGHEEVAELLMEREDADVNLLTENGESPLLLAAGYHGSVNLTKALLALIAIDVNLKSSAGHSALLLSVRNDHLECCRLLLDHDDIDVNLQDINGMTCLMFASLLGHVDMVRILFSHPGTDPNLRCRENGSTALILAARNNRTAIIELLVARRNVNINMADDFGSTALNHCVRRNSRQALYYLLERPEIDINISDAEGKTPLLRACSDGYYDLAMIFLARHEVDVNKQTLEGKTALMYAAQMPDGLAAIKLMLAMKEVEVNAVDEHEATALLVACKNGNTGAVAAILEACSMEAAEAEGLHLLKEARDEQGYTPLMWATLLGFVNIVRLLLQVRGLDLNALSPDGLTALGLSCETGHIHVTQALTSHPNVDVNSGQDSESGRTAIVAALERYQHESVAVLLQHPSHSLARSKVRPPYLPPVLKNMVDLYRQHYQPRAALVLSCPPPSLVVDGAGVRRGARGGGGTATAGGAEMASALLQLPRPFQVVQHELKKVSSTTLANYMREFTKLLDQSEHGVVVTKRLDQSEHGVVVLYISGELLLTPEGPALSLSSPTPSTPPTHVLLSSMVASLHPHAGTLLLLLDVLAVSVTASLHGAKHVLKSPEGHVLPPLCHQNMAVLAGIGGRRKLALHGGHQSSLFSEAVARELLHGVTLQQLHQRVTALLRHWEHSEQRQAKKQRQDTQDNDMNPSISSTANDGSETALTEEWAQSSNSRIIEGSEGNNLENNNNPGVQPENIPEAVNEKGTEESLSLDQAAVETQKKQDSTTTPELRTAKESADELPADTKSDEQTGGYKSVYSADNDDASIYSADVFSSRRSKFLDDHYKATKSSSETDSTSDSKASKNQQSDTENNDNKPTTPTSLPLPLFPVGSEVGATTDSSTAVSPAAESYPNTPRRLQKTTVLFASNMSADWRF